MDDQTHNSPPSSRKSSVLGKLDRPETPNRGSPYQTRSRKSSTLTEENIAMHNDTPTSRGAPTRRITRRMSQSSENPVVLTPMPQAAKRTRRSPSVASGDDLMSTPKKKFSVAQENVVIEEDETVEENKLELTGASTNGSKIENEGDKENINTIVNGNASDETLPHKSLDASDSNKTGSVVEQPLEPKILTETAPANSNELAVSTSNSDALPVEVSTKITESVNANVSATQTSSPPSTSESLDQNVTVLSQTAVAINEQSDSDSPKLSESMLDIVQKFTSEMNTTVAENLETTSASLNFNDTSIVDLSDTVCEMKTPNKLAPISATDAIVVPETPNASIIIIPDTPIQIQKSSITATPNMFSTPDNPQTPKLNPSTVQSIQQVDSPKTPVQAKTSATNDVIGRVTRLSMLKTPKVLPSAVQAVQQVDSPKTPVQVKNAVTPDVTPVTPLAIPKTVPATQQLDSVTQSKTPPQTIAVTTPVAIRKTANTVVDVIPSTPNSVLNVTESEEENLLRTPPTPSKPASELKSKVEVAKDVPSVEKTPKTPNTPKLGVDTAETTPLQNGNVDENTESKWGSSIRRKSDGKPIDKFGVTKLSAETETSKPIKNTSTVHIVDTSDEESCDDADSNHESGSRNMFLDDEAMESNGEASMDEEERKYMEENEIPVDGISLGSESDEAMSEEEESDDSFIVSDSSVQLLDGTGDDIGSASVKLDTSANKSKRGNKILDTSDEESKEEPKKPSKKRRPDSSLNRTAKYSRVDDEDDDEEDDQHNNVNESGDEDELANLDVEPKKTRSSKRLSESTSLSKKDTKRLSLHPNMKLSSLESNGQETDVNKSDSLEADDNSEEDVTQELANLDEEPKRITRSTRHSESFESSKKDNKRMSLHPNTKLSSVKLIQKENELSSVNLNLDESTEKGAPTTAEESSKAFAEEELANLDNEPKKSKSKKRLSELNSVSKKEMKRLSLHPNTKLSSVESNEGEQEQNREQQQQSKADGNDSTGATIVLEDGKDIADELANLDDEPKIKGKSKRLSDAMPTSKNDTKRLSLHPNAKLNRSGFDFKVFASTVITTETNDVEKIASAVPNTAANVQSAPDAGQEKMEVERSVEEIQAKCDELLQLANETRRLEKLNKQPMQEDKYQRLKEKKAAKLKEKKEKEAREKEREAQAEAQRQLKRDKKSKIAQLTEQEKSKAIQKAIDFSETIKARKAQHSIVVTGSSESTEEERIPSPVKTKKRKPKRLQILNEEPNQTKKKRRVVDTEEMPAKPEGFKASSIPVKSRGNKIKEKPGKDKEEGDTSAGSFTVEPMPTSSATPFVVTTLQSNPAIKFSSFKDKAISNSNVQRVSSAELLNRKKKQKKMQNK